MTSKPRSKLDVFVYSRDRRFFKRRLHLIGHVIAPVRERFSGVPEITWPSIYTVLGPGVTLYLFRVSRFRTRAVLASGGSLAVPPGGYG